MAKKSFKGAVADYGYSNPAEAFFTSAPKKEDPKPKKTGKPKADQPQAAEVPAARGQWLHRAQHVEGSESYTKRVQLLMRPSTHAKAKQMAAAQGMSLNNFINGLVEDYVDQEGA